MWGGFTEQGQGLHCAFRGTPMWGHAGKREVRLDQGWHGNLAEWVGLDLIGPKWQRDL